MRTKILATLLTLGFALWGAAAWADDMTSYVEPFARSAEIYQEGYQAFGPPENLPTREDLERVIVIPDGVNWVPYSPVYMYRLSEPEHFHFDLRTLDPLELGAPSVGN